MDYYSILGVGRNASQDEIKRAYRKLAMKHHPDRGGDTQTLAQINEAYDTLKDPAKRQQYDNPQPRFDTSHMNQNPFGQSGFDDIFTSMFGHQHRRPRQPRNNDITLAADIDLVDVIKGKTLILSYRLASGKTETVEVDIPSGAKHGDAVKFQGLGDDANPRFPRGDLLVKIRLRRTRGWDRDGNNLITSQIVDVFDLVLGTVTIIETLDGRKVKLNIPKGTKPGQVFSIPEYGIPDLNTRQKGHLYVKIEARIPNIKDPKLIARLKELQDEINLQS
jgi:curved DNA-binding protein